MSLPNMLPVKSTNVESIGYRDGDLFVRYHDKAVYKFTAVPADLYKALQATDSVGKFMHGRIQGKFESTKLVIDDKGEPHPLEGLGEDPAPTIDAELIIKAVEGLNPDDDAHWNEAGQPDLNVLSDVLNARVTREQVEAVTDRVRPVAPPPDTNPEAEEYAQAQAAAQKELLESGILDFFKEKHGVTGAMPLDRNAAGAWTYILNKEEVQAFTGTLEELKAIKAAG